jgi:hypothetical protein
VSKSVQTSLLVVTLLAIWVCVLAGVFAVISGLAILQTGSEMNSGLFACGTLAALAYAVARAANAARNRGKSSHANGDPS